jgi:hypothetical protein
VRKSSGSARAFLWIGLTAWFAGTIFLGSNNFFVALRAHRRSHC